TEAIATTTTVTTTVPAVPEEPFRCGGFNEWGFVNDRDAIAQKDYYAGPFGDRAYYTYFLTDADREKLFSMLSDVERDVISSRMNNPDRPADGFCYGMSATSILAYYGIIRPSELIANRANLSQIDAQDCQTSEKVRSTVNYYQLLQYTKIITQMRAYIDGCDDAKKIQYLLNSLKDGKPVLLGYTYKGPTGDTLGHAVVAYAAESQMGEMTRYKQPNFKYDTRIRIYENIDGKNSYQNDMLVNSATSEWCIPRTERPDTYDGAAQIIMNNSDYKSGTISLLLSEPDLINYCGLFGGTEITSDMKDQKYLKFHGLGDDTITRGDKATVRYAPLSGLNAYGDYNVLEKASDGSLNAPSTKNKLRFSSDLSDGSAGGGTKEYTANFDSVYGFYLSPVTDSAQNMSVSAEYEHFLMRAGANAKRIQFTPDAEIECSGSSGAYELSMVADKEIRAIDWHKLTVSGMDGGDLKMQLQPDGSGVILSGDSLKNVTVKANSYTTEAARTFSTNYASV
ncbi:MAG: hypothetical protein MJ065_10220, partial [Oscillospiraceae bacterium]|nr:hypothetical protein [Oscillospiraceae bacterium]